MKNTAPTRCACRTQSRRRSNGSRSRTASASTSSSRRPLQKSSRRCAPRNSSPSPAPAPISRRSLFADVIDGVTTLTLGRLDLDSLIRALTDLANGTEDRLSWVARGHSIRSPGGRDACCASFVRRNRHGDLLANFALCSHPIRIACHFLRGHRRPGRMGRMPDKVQATIACCNSERLSILPQSGSLLMTCCSNSSFDCSSI